MINYALPQMGGMESMSSKLDLLPPWVTALWLVGLAAVLVFHCGHFARIGGQHRWFHASHILMLVSMLYMFASMEYKWKWFPKSLWVVIFELSTAALAGWMIFRLVQRRRFSFVWMFALIMQAAMIYMWMTDWAPALTWTIVVYYGLETVAWLGGLLDDTKRAMAGAPSRGAVVEAVAPSSTRSGAPAGLAVGVLDDSKRMTVLAPSPRFVVMAQSSALARVSMAIMAASMGYMFAAMQIMR
ncbi:MAG: hypothetical protein ABI474_11405 [Actinomycetota bacterium]